MSIQRETQIIANSPYPITVESMVADLASLGVEPESVLLVHSALSRLGWVCGGPVSVVLALEEALGLEGTLVMPTHCGDNSDPALWKNPPVPADWVDTIRDQMPAYDPNLTPTRGMGKIVETFRKQKGVIRSDHPQGSFAARGPFAQLITADHQLTYDLGDGSPLQKIYDLDGWILLLGVGHGNNTSLHLAENRAQFPGKKTIQQGASINVNGQRKWVSFQVLDLNDDDFVEIGQAYMQYDPHAVKRGKVGLADALLMRQRPLVDFAVQWMQVNRK